MQRHFREETQQAPQIQKEEHQRFRFQERKRNRRREEIRRQYISLFDDPDKAEDLLGWMGEGSEASAQKLPSNPSTIKLWEDRPLEQDEYKFEPQYTEEIVNRYIPNRGFVPVTEQTPKEYQEPAFKAGDWMGSSGLPGAQGPFLERGAKGEILSHDLQAMFDRGDVPQSIVAQRMTAALADTSYENSILIKDKYYSLDDIWDDQGNLINLDKYMAITKLQHDEYLHAGSDYKRKLLRKKYERYGLSIPVDYIDDGKLFDSTGQHDVDPGIGIKDIWDVYANYPGAIAGLLYGGTFIDDAKAWERGEIDFDEFNRRLAISAAAVPGPLRFLADVLLDPLTYIGVGFALKVAKVGVPIVRPLAKPVISLAKVIASTFRAAPPVTKLSAKMLHRSGRLSDNTLRGILDSGKVLPDKVAKDIAEEAFTARLQREGIDPQNSKDAKDWLIRQSEEASMQRVYPQTETILREHSLRPRDKFLSRGTVGGGDVGADIRDLFHFSDLQPGLTAIEHIERVVWDFTSKVPGFKRANTWGPNAFGTTGMKKALKDAQGPHASAARVYSQSTSADLIDAFGGSKGVTKDERVPALQGILKDIPGAPTIQDIAARRTAYFPYLNTRQQAALANAEIQMTTFVGRLKDLGVDLIKEAGGVRPDIMRSTDPLIPHGFYLPRGAGEMIEEGGESVWVRGINQIFGKGDKGAGRRYKPWTLKPSVWDSQAQGWERGTNYDSIQAALNSYYKWGLSRGNAEITAKFFKEAKDPLTGELLGSTSKLRMLRHSSALDSEYKGLVKELNRLKGLGARLTEQTDEIISVFTRESNPFGGAKGDLEKFANAIKAITVQEGRNKGATKAVIKDAIDKVKTRIDSIKPNWEAAVKLSEKTPKDYKLLETNEWARGMVAPLQGWSFPKQVTKAMERELKVAQPTVWRDLNSLGRTLNSTLDDSAPLIQGLIGVVLSPTGWGKAYKAHIRGFHDSLALGRYINDRNAWAAANGHPSVQKLVRLGLHIGGNTGEFLIGDRTGLVGTIGRLWGIKHANRGFGYYGDFLRINLAYSELETLKLANQSLPALERSGQLRALMQTINNATGYSDLGTVGVADVVNYAPRFFQARAQFYAKAIQGLAPGATLEKRFARRAMLRLIGVGWAVTETANFAQGHETDRRLYVTVNGKKRFNTNFMRIHFMDRDYSVFGPWKAIPELIAMLAVARSPGDFSDIGRRLATSPMFSTAWDIISGEDFIGIPTRDTWPQKIRTIFTTFMPFSTQEMVDMKWPFGSLEDFFKTAVILAGEAVGVSSAAHSITDMEIDEAKRLNKELTDEEMFAIRGQEGKFDPYNLNSKDRDYIRDNSPEIQEKFDERERPRNLKEELPGRLKDRENQIDASEQVLKEQLDRGIEGKAKRDEIEKYLTRRYSVSNILLGEEFQEIFDEKQHGNLEDVMADAYWSQICEKDIYNEWDCIDRDKRREEILADAKQRGVSETYITDTWLRDRFGADVREVVEGYLKDMEFLSPYFEFKHSELKRIPGLWEFYMFYTEQSKENRDSLDKTREGIILDREIKSINQTKKEWLDRPENVQYKRTLDRWK
tara:strand:- start:11 stop:4732 length:4722 start_codon:yes stop_codon:yes gene_type:complete